MPTSTDPERLEREAAHAELAAAIDALVDIATSQHTHDSPTGRHYRLVIEAARAQLAAPPQRPDYRVIFKAEPVEIIVSQVPFRGRMYVATDRRILEWDPDTETMRVLERHYDGPQVSNETVEAAANHIANRELR